MSNLQAKIDRTAITWLASHLPLSYATPLLAGDSEAICLAVMKLEPPDEIVPAILALGMLSGMLEAGAAVSGGEAEHDEEGHGPCRGVHIPSPPE
jgi:hypothetical protein